MMLILICKKAHEEIVVFFWFLHFLYKLNLHSFTVLQFLSQNFLVFKNTFNAEGQL